MHAKALCIATALFSCFCYDQHHLFNVEWFKFKNYGWLEIKIWSESIQEINDFENEEIINKESKNFPLNDSTDVDLNENDISLQVPEPEQEIDFQILKSHMKIHIIQGLLNFLNFPWNSQLAT